MKPYASRHSVLSTQDGYLLWGNRVIVPLSLQSTVLMELHVGHPGVSCMRALVCMYMWWPGIDKDIESLIRSCQECQSDQTSPPTAPLHPWTWPSTPWSRLHIDFAGPFIGHNFLVVIDAHSKWMSSTTSSAVIDKLRSLFAQFGLPQVLVSDNGSSFVSKEFKCFTRINGIQHLTSSPYHPASNGLEERAVKTFKNGLKKMSKGSVLCRLTRFLFSHRNMPQITTGVAPAELLIGIGISLEASFGSYSHQYTKTESSTQSATDTWPDTIPPAPESPLSTAYRCYPSRVRHPLDRLAY